MNGISIILVEDCDATRAQLCHAIALDAQLQLRAAVGSYAMARQVIKQRCDVALIDLGLPDGDGMDLIRQLAQHSPAPAIMVITAFDDELHVLAAIRAGASGYVLKDAGPEAIIAAIRQMLAGGAPISPAIAGYLLRTVRATAGAAVPLVPSKVPLTDRELQILRLVAKGYRYSEIAGLLQIGSQTVATHTKSIYRKLSVSSKNEAVYEAMQSDWFDVDRVP
jgi:DNA-binding NarL/FixJ family response regulator